MSLNNNRRKRKLLLKVVLLLNAKITKDTCRQRWPNNIKNLRTIIMIEAKVPQCSLLVPVPYYTIIYYYMVYTAVL